MATSGAKSGLLGGLGQWWGVLAGALLIAAWINGAAGPAVIIALSAVVLLWSFFQAPVTCGARSEDEKTAAATTRPAS